MRCQFCDGGKIDWPTLIDGRQHTVKIDCPECGGTGHLHCCEGLREQPHPTMLLQAEQDRPEIPANARIARAVRVPKGNCEDEPR